MVAAMASRKFVIGGAALTALFARVRRRPKPEKPLEPELEDDGGDELAAEEVYELREELRRELERLAEGDIKASRTRRERTSPPG
jgi:hypothetical protein